MTKIFLSAGEASGEGYAVRLMQALGERVGALDVFGLGGVRMKQAGMRRVVRAEDVAVMGITEILRHVPRIYGEYRKLKQSLRTEKPDVAVLIDFPDVNLALAKHCKRLGIPTVFFVGPQVWAWKQYRLKRIRRDVDRMLVIFPFEEGWYRERGVDSTFVGHPLAHQPLPDVTPESFAAAHGLVDGRRVVALLPGSRMHEIALNLPTMLEAARLLERERPGQHEFVIPVAPTLRPDQLKALRRLAAEHGKGLPLLFSYDARATLRVARASVVASGTATVEAALMGNPFVVVYRMTWLSHAIAKRVVKVPHVAMANLIAGRRVVPELIQDAYTPEAVLAALKDVLDDGAARTAMMDSLAGIGGMLRLQRDPIESVAEVVLSSAAESKMAVTR